VPYGVSLERLNETVRDFATYISQTNLSDILAHEQSLIAELFEPTRTVEEEEEEEDGEFTDDDWISSF
jgi:hypothetical protein